MSRTDVIDLNELQCGRKPTITDMMEMIPSEKAQAHNRNRLKVPSTATRCVAIICPMHATGHAVPPVRHPRVAHELPSSRSDQLRVIVFGGRIRFGVGVRAAIHPDIWKGRESRLVHPHWHCGRARILLTQAFASRQAKMGGGKTKMDRQNQLP